MRDQLLTILFIVGSIKPLSFTLFGHYKCIYFFSTDDNGTHYDDYWIQVNQRCYCDVGLLMTSQWFLSMNNVGVFYWDMTTEYCSSRESHLISCDFYIEIKILFVISRDLNLNWGLYFLKLSIYLGPSWSWSYGSWIYHYQCILCLSPLKSWVETYSWWGVLDKTLCDKVCQWLATSRCFSPGTPGFFHQ